MYLDPSKPKIPVSPRSRSAQDPSQPKIPVNTRSQSAWILRPHRNIQTAFLVKANVIIRTVRVLVHTYISTRDNIHTYGTDILGFHSCLVHTKLDFTRAYVSRYMAHAYLVFGSCLFSNWLMPIWHLVYYIPTLISVMRIWHMRIFHSLKKRMSQGPAVNGLICRYLGMWTSIPLLLLLALCFGESSAQKIESASCRQICGMALIWSKSSHIHEESSKKWQNWLWNFPNRYNFP